MNWTQDQIESIPPVYRDFMMALRPVVETAGASLQVTGIPRGRISTVLRMRAHPFEVDDVAHVLERQLLVEKDKFGFFRPTAKGEDLIRAMIGDLAPAVLPPLPPL